MKVFTGSVVHCEDSSFLSSASVCLSRPVEFGGGRIHPEEEVLDWIC